MLEINKMNNRYLKYIRLIEEKNYKIMQWQKEIDGLAGDYKIEEANRIKAKRENRKEDEQKANDQIKLLRKRAEEIETQANLESEEIRDILQKIEGLLQNIFEDSTLKDNMRQSLEEKYVSKIEELIQKQKRLEISYETIEEIRKIIQEKPALIKEMQNAVESLAELRRIDYRIYNLEHNGMLSKKEASNQELLEKSKKEKIEQEKRKKESYANMRDILSAPEYALIEEKIKEMVEICLKENGKVKVNKKIERQAKEFKQQITRIEESINANKKELSLLQQKKKKKWWNRNRKEKENKKEETLNQRKEFLDRIAHYEIVREGMHQMKNEIREQREKEEKTK